jgi:site-specific DNA-methyltransferase (adenine-specific)
MNVYYEDEYCTLVHGDCLDVMREMVEKGLKFSSILTDPPYGTITPAWDNIISFEPMWDCIKGLIVDRGAILLFGTEPFSSHLRLSNIDWFKYDWIYEKTRASDFLNSKNKPLKAHEIISVFSNGTTANGSKRKMLYYPQMSQGKPYYKKHATDPRVGYVEKGNRKEYLGFNDNKGERYPRSVIKFSNNNQDSFHPTQKPIELMEYLVSTYTKEGDTILDFTCGSGTTLVAAKRLKRECWGIEKEEEYCKIARQRLMKEDESLF